MSHFSFFILVLISTSIFAQKKWDGGGGTNAWSNPANWTGNILPSASDDVVLDNSVINTSYNVLLPSTAVTVKSITITAGINKNIELTLPNTNTLAPALTVSGTGYGMTLNAGAVFRNSSGSSSGTSVNVLDSIKIVNTGRYIHNTAGAHTLNVHKLSVAPGTETGTFEFDIPTASSTISLSGRKFGKLVLKSQAAGGTCNYTAAGTSRVMIRSNLEIGTGVNLNLNFSDTIFILGDLLQQGGTFNVGNAPRSVVIFIGQNLIQSPGAIITETGTGLQSIVMGSSRLQQMDAKGSWLNQVALVKSGGGALALKDDLSLPYKLILRSGRIVTSENWLLTLQPSCSIEADSLATDTYIEGPLKKDGLINSSFLFPVGTNGKLRWLQLEQATGNFIVYYFKNDPHSLSSGLGAGLHHISSVEYWNVASSANSSAVVKLSFDDPHSGGVTNMSALRVARLEFANWQNAGNTSYSGSPGSNGWVSSTAASGFSANTKSFALASAISQENPLPMYDLRFNGAEKNGNMYFTWKVIGDDDDIAHFELEESNDGQRFTTSCIIDAVQGVKTYSREIACNKFAEYFKLKVKNKDGFKLWETACIRANRRGGNTISLSGGNVVRSRVLLEVKAVRDVIARICVVNAVGAVVASADKRLPQGYSRIEIEVGHLKSGLYYVRDLSGSFAAPAMKVVLVNSQ